MNRKNITAALLLLASVLTAMTACGGDAGTTEPTTDTQGTASVTETAAAEPAYQYGNFDCNGEEFHILNTNTTWGFYTTIYHEATTGDILDDTIFEANSKVEEAFNVKLKVTEFDITATAGEYSKTILSGDDVYQTALMSAGRSSSVMLESYVMDLSEIPEMHLDEPWWDQQVKEYSHLGGSDRVFFGISDINLMNFEVIEGVYVNDDMLANLDLPLLYDSVRDGTWTLSKMHEYMKAAVNLNGDTDWKFSLEGNAVYGMTFWEQTTPALMYGCGLDYIKLDADGIPHLNVENEHFYNVTAKIAEMFKTKGETVYLNQSAQGLHYEDAFRDGRSLFTLAQLKGSTKFRDMEDAYGILPAPKYDEAQERYYSFCTSNIVASTIPVTCGDPHRAAAIIDAMAYHAYADILPVYYGVNVQQKQMRNEDSIEMLAIIGDTRAINIGNIYGWTTDLDTAIYKQLSAGNASIASIVASYTPKVEKLFEDTLALFTE
jgi:ABC-type glycerol-3-phosphate transport system substrate-binding protein